MKKAREPKLCFHKATGQFYIRLNGDCTYLGTDEAKAAAERERLLAEAKGCGGTGPAKPSGVTVGELAEAYGCHCDVHYRHPDGTPTSEVRVIGLAVRPLIRRDGETPATEFGPRALRAVRENMLDGSWMTDEDREKAGVRAKGGWCRGVINANVRRIVRMFRWGVSVELVPETVATALEMVPPLLEHRTKARESEEVRPAPPESVEAVLALANRQVAAIMRFQILTGARPGEACILRPCDLDRNGSLVSELVGEPVALPAGVWVYLPGIYRTKAGTLKQAHKTAHHDLHKFIPVGPKAQEVLAPFLAGRALELPCFSPREAEVERRLVMYASQRKKGRPGRAAKTVKFRKGKHVPGESYQETSYAHALRHLMNAANRKRLAEGLAVLPRFHPHQLRHSAATRLKREFGWEVARIILGHTSVAMTERYVARDLANAFGAVAAAG